MLGPLPAEDGGAVVKFNGDVLFKPLFKGAEVGWKWSQGLYAGQVSYPANVDAASMYASSGWGPWDPWFDAYIFIPGGGIWYSPFGWGFYSPWLAYESPFFGYGYGYGGWGYPHHFSNYREWEPRLPYVAVRLKFREALLTS